MTASLFLLLPISLALVVLIGVAFWWAIFSGQFDNTQQAAESILHDDDSGQPDESQTPLRRAGHDTSGSRTTPRV
jgi:cbb3-type cytochrome oxidase maturation protein